jgi:hypothetical protein
MSHDLLPIGGVRPIIEVIPADEPAPLIQWHARYVPAGVLADLLAAAELALPVLGARCGRGDITGRPHGGQASITRRSWLGASQLLCGPTSRAVG